MGPAGSGTPALSASAEADKGLAETSGKIAIPALQAGQTAVVRVSGVTSGKDTTGMFRLRLNMETPGELLRKIVVEGRTGFSLVSGGVGRQSQMFFSPKGSFVISGLPGAVSLIEAATLEGRIISMPSGWVLLSAAFSPDETRVVLTVFAAAAETGLSVLTDSKLTAAANLPPQTQFLRWQINDKLLLRGQSGLVEYSLVLSAGLPFVGSNGWGPNLVIAGTDIVVLQNAEGGWAVRNGAPLQHRLAPKVAGNRSGPSSTKPATGSIAGDVS